MKAFLLFAVVFLFIAVFNLHVAIGCAIGIGFLELHHRHIIRREAKAALERLRLYGNVQ